MTVLHYVCCDCNDFTTVSGLDAVPEPARCLVCHMLALSEVPAMQAWLCSLHRARLAARGAARGATGTGPQDRAEASPSQPVLVRT